MRKIIYLLPSYLSLLLSGCFVDKRIQYFVEGHFIGINDYDNETIFYLDIYKINVNENLVKNKINIVEDYAKGGYYLIDFYKFDEEGLKINYDFINLTPTTATAMNIHYFDENKNEFTPFYSDEFAKYFPSNHYDSYYYTIFYDYNLTTGYRIGVNFYMEDVFNDKQFNSAC